MGIIKKSEGILRLGGPVLVAKKIGDHLFGTDHAEMYLYNKCRTADLEDYPELLTEYYKSKTGEILDLHNPQTFNEKIQCMKLYDSTSMKTRLADKLLVRDWVSEMIGSEYLIPLLGFWDEFDKVDFGTLPDSFVLKCNHGSRWNIIVKNKSKMDMVSVKEKIDKWMGLNFAFICGFELQYKDIVPRIIAEEYIEELDGDLLDYKIHVFGGKPEIIQVIGKRDNDAHKAKEAFLDTEWNLQSGIRYHTYDSFDYLPDKPDNLGEMVDIAGKLGHDFKYVRVDLYNISGKIYFGEMTFTPSSGFGKWGGRNGDLFNHLGKVILVGDLSDEGREDPKYQV